MAEDNKRNVRWSVFVWAIAVLLTLFVSAVSVSMSAKADVGEVKGQVLGIETDLSWIKGTLTEIKNEIKDLK